jgi:LuxR family transcriptional regulator, maltose regulon positive regulatory protein
MSRKKPVSPRLAKVAKPRPGGKGQVPRSLAKLSKPVMGRTLARPRLFESIDRADARVIWVSGPPGAGKTTLLSTYISARARPALWYQIDGGDNDIAAFFYYLREAPGKRPKAGLPLLTPEYLPDLKGFARRYFRALFGMLPPRSVLVFDNYHELEPSSPLHSLLREAFEEIPQGVTILIASRSAPPAEYARLIAARALTRLEWEELRLTRAEVEAVLSQSGPVGSEELDTLCAQCDGWAAGLVLLLEQRARAKGRRAAPSTSPQTVFDYLATEIFNSAEPRVRDFMLRAAFLPHIKPEMAAALSGNPDAGEQLESLYRRQLFTNRSETAFEFHPLLREFLLARARAELSKEELTDLARRAALLLEADGQTAEAAQLYRDAGDWTRLERLIGEQAGGLLVQGRHGTLEAWIALMPQEQAEASSWLLYWRGTARLAALDPVQGRGLLERAFAKFKLDDELAGQFLACAGVLNSYFIEWDDFTPTDPWMRELEALIARSPNMICPEIEAQVMSSAIPILYRQPQHPLITAWQDRGLEIFRTSKIPQQRMALSAFLLNQGIWRGDYRRCAALIQEIQARSDPGDEAPLMLISLRCWEAILWFALAEHDSAYKASDEALSLARESGVHLLDAMAHGYSVFTAASAGELDRAKAALAKMENCVIPSRGHDVSFVCHQKSVLALVRGELAEARHYASEVLGRVEAAGAMFNVALAQGVLAQVLIEQGEHREARRLLVEARKFMEAMPGPYFVFMGWLAEANSYGLTQEWEPALAALRTALALGRKYDYMTAHPVWLPKVMSRLCALALEHGIEADYVARLIKKRGLLAPTPEAVDWPFPVKIYTLGRFSMLVDGKPLQSAGRAQRKPLELLMALVALGGRDVSESQLTEALWPDADGSAAHEVCAVNLHRLRKLLGYDRAISLQGNRFSLDPGCVWVDVWAFERGLAAPQPVLDRALALYRGPFLGKDADLSWALPMRERLRAKFTRHLSQWGASLLKEKDFDLAITILERGLNVDPLAEEFYRHLMLCYQGLSRRAEAIGVYQRCQKTLSTALGVSPAPETIALYQTLQR